MGRPPLWITLKKLSSAGMWLSALVDEPPPFRHRSRPNNKLQKYNNYETRFQHK
jgi:hypothetical protein